MYAHVHAVPRSREALARWLTRKCQSQKRGRSHVKSAALQRVALYGPRLATDDFSGAFKALRYAAVKEKSCVYRILPSPVALLAAWRGRHEKTGNPCDCRFDASVWIRSSHCSLLVLRSSCVITNAPSCDSIDLFWLSLSGAFSHIFWSLHRCAWFDAYYFMILSLFIRWTKVNIHWIFTSFIDKGRKMDIIIIVKL